jgi:Ca2+-binding RTX toxin-like protein
VLTGGAGEDVFVFDQQQTDFDRDVVTDFNGEEDKLDLSATNLNSWADFQAAAFEVDGSVFVDTGLGHVELENTQLADIGQEDVVF